MNGIHHVALAVADVSRAVSFYTETIGLEAIGPDDPTNDIETAAYFWLRCGSDQWVNLARKPNATPTESGLHDDPHVALRASESAVDALADRLADAGIEVRESETSVYFRGPDGNFVEVTHWHGPDEVEQSL